MTGFLVYSVIFSIGLLGLLDVLLNFYYASLGHSPETIGLLQALPRLAGFLTSVPIGLLTDRIGTRRMLIVATVGTVLSLWLQLIPVLPLLVLSRFFFGLAYGAQQIANAPMMIDLVDAERRTRFFALHNFLMMAAMAFGSFIGGFLPGWIVRVTQPFSTEILSPTSAFAYGVAIFLGGLIGLLSVLPLLRLGDAPSVEIVREASADAPTPALGTLAQAVRGQPIPWKMLGLATLPMLSFGFSGGLTFPFYNLFWREQFSLPDQTVGTILSIGWIGMALLPLLNPRVERRFGRVGGLRLSMLISAAAFALLGLQALLLLSVGLFVVAISFRNMMNPLFQPLLLESLPHHLANVASSMSMVMWNVGWFAATALGGFIAERFGFAPIMLLVAAAVLLTGLVIPAIFRPRGAITLYLPEYFASADVRKAG